MKGKSGKGVVVNGDRNESLRVRGVFPAARTAPFCPTPSIRHRVEAWWSPQRPHPYIGVTSDMVTYTVRDVNGGAAGAPSLGGWCELHVPADPLPLPPPPPPPTRQSHPRPHFAPRTPNLNPFLSTASPGARFIPRG